MEQAHRLRIQKNWIRLLEDLFPDRVVPYLIQDEIFSIRDKQDIGALKTDHDKNSKILETLMRKGPRAYGSFLNALQETSPHLYNLMKDPVIVKTVSAVPVRKNIDVYRCILSDITSSINTEELLPKLYSRGSITHLQYEQLRKLQEHKGSTTTATKLFSEMLPRAPDKESFGKILQALEDSNQNYLAKIMSQEYERLMGKPDKAPVQESNEKSTSFRMVGESNPHNLNTAMAASQPAADRPSGLTRSEQEAVHPSMTQHVAPAHNGHNKAGESGQQPSGQQPSGQQPSGQQPVSNVPGHPGSTSSDQGYGTNTQGTTTPSNQGVMDFQDDAASTYMNEPNSHSFTGSNIDPHPVTMESDTTGHQGYVAGNQEYPADYQDQTTSQAYVALDPQPSGFSTAVQPSSLDSEHLTSKVVLIKPEELKMDRNNMLGRGSYGMVFKGYWNKSEVAIKDINFQFRSKRKQQMQDAISREIEISAAIRHPNVVLLMAYAFDSASVYLVHELIEGHSLERILFDDEIKCQYNLQYKDKVSIAYDMSKALTFLHSQNPIIIHGDIKPANVLIKQRSLEAKLCDLGISKLKSRDVSTTKGGINEKGCCSYNAPEIVLHKQATTTRTDVYSFGVTVLELFAEAGMWEHCDDEEEKIKEFMEAEDEKVSPLFERLTPGPLKSILFKCLFCESIKRPTAENLVDVIKPLVDGASQNI